MRASSVASALLAASCGFVCAAPLSAQERGEPANQMHYPMADELAGLLKGAEQAKAEGRLDDAVEAYRAVLDTDHQKSGYQIAQRDAQTPRGGPYRRYIGITEWALEGLRSLPPQGRARFRERFDYRAASAQAEARKAPDAYLELCRVYERYPIATQAPAILEEMGDLALERGELERALRAFERLLAFHAQELPSPPRVRQKLLVCAMGLGQTARVRALVAEVKKDDPRGQVFLSGTPVDPNELIERALFVESARAGRDRPTGADSPLPRVDPANRASVLGKLAPGPARYGVKNFATSLGPAGRIGGGTPALHLPVVDKGALYVVTADQVLAWDLMTGEERPRIPRLGQIFSSTDRDKVQHAGAITQETLVVPLVDEVLRDQQYRGIPIKVRIPICKYAGFDTGGWRWSWTHSRDLDSTKMARWSFPAPATAVEGVVFAPAYSIEGFINSYVAAFDARTGKPRWDSWLVSGQVEQTMFGEQAREPLVTPVAVSDGVVYHSTSFGCVAALDADTGRPLWVTEYEQTEVKAPRGYYAEIRELGWQNNAPIVCDGVCVAAPLDSPSYIGLDTKTGERLWVLPRRRHANDSDLGYLVGATGEGGQGVLVVAGGTDVFGISLRGGKILWQAKLSGRPVAGRGVIVGEAVAIPVDRNQMFVFQVTTGKKLGSGPIELSTSGNVLVVGEHLIVTGNGQLGVHRNGGKEGQDF